MKKRVLINESELYKASINSNSNNYKNNPPCKNRKNKHKNKGQVLFLHRLSTKVFFEREEPYLKITILIII